MDENIVIIQHSDFNRWKEIIKIVGDYGWFLADEDFERHLKGFGHENFNVIVAVDKSTDKVIGTCVTGFHEPIETSPAAANLGPYIVLPEYQGKGVGTKLFEVALSDPCFKNANLGLYGAAVMSPKYAKTFGYDKFPDWHLLNIKIKISDIDISTLNSYISGINIVDFNKVDYQKLIEYDTKIQGGIRRDKFLKAFLDTKTNFVKIAIDENSGEILGIGNIRTGVKNQLGLGPLYANSKTIAETLLKQVIESIENFGSFDYLRIYTPNVNKDAFEIFSRLCNGKIDSKIPISYPQFTKYAIQIIQLLFEYREMDLSNNSPSTFSRNETPMNVQSKRAKFLSTYRRHQIWSLPDSIIYYITKNPSTPKIYEKLIQTCKYFFIKNPILIVPSLNHRYHYSHWITWLNGKCVNLGNLSSKIWVTERLFVSDSNSNDRNSLSSLISKIYQCDAKLLNLNMQICSINDLKFLGSKCEKVWFFRITVLKDDDGSVDSLENVIEIFPKIESFDYDFGKNGSKMISSKTVVELLKIPHFANLTHLSLTGIPESFDIDTFYGYIKTNKKTKIQLNFCRETSVQYNARLQSIVNEIIAAEKHDFEVPLINFNGFFGDALFKMLNLYYK